jgi:HEAT repeat protein
LPIPAYAHGGVYRGPGGTVPPGAGGASGGGPSTPVGPGGAAVTSWAVWWTFNRDQYLRVKEHIHQADSLSGNDDFYLGKGQTRAARDSRPEPEVLQSEVVPALLESLEGTENQDLITASLMALGKLGLDGPNEESIEGVLRSYLAHSNQEVAETAAVALGLFGRASSSILLEALVSDGEAGRKAVRRKEVPYRTRAFAAYGIGQLGASSERREVRALAVRCLLKNLSRDETPTSDLPTACLLSLGLCPLKVTGKWESKRTAPRSVSSLEDQVAWLLNWFEDVNHPTAIKTHAPGTLARLALAGGDEVRAAVAEALLKTLKRRGLERDVERAILIALGRLADSDQDPVDVQVRKRLWESVKAADGPGRALARVSMARILARPGDGEDSQDAFEKGRAWFLKDLASGKSTTRAWTGMALGLLSHERTLRGMAVSPEVTRALHSSLKGTRNPRDVGALCIAIGLAGDPSSAEVLLETFNKSADDGLRSSAATGLGLLQAMEAREDIASSLKKAQHRPGLLRELATALVMLGDRSALPQLVKGLREASNLADQSSHAFAIGRVGDRRAVQPLLLMLTDRSLGETTRAFAAAALGVVAHSSDLPWNALLAMDLQYGQVPPSLSDGSRGVLDLL